MTAYNISVREFRHQDGSKNYHLLMIWAPNSMQADCHVIRRFGKIGVTGQLQTKQYPTRRAAVDDFDKEKKKRLSAKKGYDLVREFEENWSDGIENRLPSKLEDTACSVRISDEIYSLIGNYPQGNVANSKPEFDPANDDLDRGETWGSW